MAVVPNKRFGFQDFRISDDQEPLHGARVPLLLSGFEEIEKIKCLKLEMQFDKAEGIFFVFGSLQQRKTENIES